MAKDRILLIWRYRELGPVGCADDLWRETLSNLPPPELISDLNKNSPGPIEILDILEILLIFHHDGCSMLLIVAGAEASQKNQIKLIKKWGAIAFKAP